MATLVPVEHDPFAPAAGLTPVEGDPFAPPVDNSWTGMGKEALRSAGEGIAGLPDLLLGPGKDIVTLTKDIINPGKGPLPLGATPTRDLYNQNLPVTPGYEKSWTREVGNVVGPTALTLGAGGVPAIVRGVGASGLKGGLTAGGKYLGDTALTSAGTIAGKEGGGALGEAVGGDFGRQVGGDIGSLLGGSLTTPAVVSTADYFGRKAFIDPQSLARFQEAQRSGVSPDLSLVGSDNATAWGSRGRAGAENRASQQEQIDAAIKAAADARRGAPASEPIAKGDVGQNVADLGATAADVAGGKANAAFGGMADTTGRGTRIDDTAMQAQLNAWEADPNVSSISQPTIDYFRNLMAADRAKGGITLNQLLAQRSVGNQSLDNAIAFDKKLRGDFKSAQTDALRDTVVGSGQYTPQQFDEINQQYGVLKDAQKQLDRIGETAAGDEAPLVSSYNKVFGAAGEQNVPLLQQLQAHGDPSGLSKLMADNLELRGRGPVAAGRPTLPRDVGLNLKGPEWWASLPEDVRGAYAGSPEIRQQIDDAMGLVRSDARRGGGQVETPDPTVPLAAGAAVLGHPIAAATAVLPKLGGMAFGGMMRSPAYAERLVNPTQLDPASGIARILAAAAATRR